MGVIHLFGKKSAVSDEDGHLSEHESYEYMIYIEKVVLALCNEYEVQTTIRKSMEFSFSLD